MASGQAMPAQRAALPGPVHHQHRDTPLDRAAAGHEPQLVLVGIQPAHGDQDRLARAAVADRAKYAGSVLPFS